MMTVKLGENIYECEKAVRSGDRATLYLTEDGGKVELVGVSDFSAIALEGGDWTAEEPEDEGDVYAALDAAYQEGVNTAYDQ